MQGWLPQDNPRCPPVLLTHFLGPQHHNLALGSCKYSHLLSYLLTGSGPRAAARRDQSDVEGTVLCKMCVSLSKSQSQIQMLGLCFLVY